jgi:hypothetical protein
MARPRVVPLQVAVQKQEKTISDTKRRRNYFTNEFELRNKKN